MPNLHPPLTDCPKDKQKAGTHRLHPPLPLKRQLLLNKQQPVQLILQPDLRRPHRQKDANARATDILHKRGGNVRPHKLVRKVLVEWGQRNPKQRRRPLPQPLPQPQQHVRQQLNNVRKLKQKLPVRKKAKKKHPQNLVNPLRRLRKQVAQLVRRLHKRQNKPLRRRKKKLIKQPVHRLNRRVLQRPQQFVPLKKKDADGKNKFVPQLRKQRLDNKPVNNNVKPYQPKVCRIKKANPPLHRLNNKPPPYKRHVRRLQNKLKPHKRRRQPVNDNVKPVRRQLPPTPPVKPKPNNVHNNVPNLNGPPKPPNLQPDGNRKQVQQRKPHFLPLKPDCRRRPVVRLLLLLLLLPPALLPPLLPLYPPVPQVPQTTQLRQTFIPKPLQP